MDRRELGQSAEDVAARFLTAQGATILVRNYRRRVGELDLVAQLGGVLLIVEVRTRSSDRYGGAAASVGFRKHQKIIRASQQLLQQHRELARLPARFDVIVVIDAAGKEPRVEWIKHAFAA